ncbi:LysM domain-containing protein [Motilibacter rhizosphaerae]|uniref:LysM domain-containing protein n=1 Tax=Motilibacter rhizosphaerae TaxID=598652 RepID=A0A4Q7NSP4_9ACTN|nr:LysM peptidoglycan-binding domain-containing protein [Motilibacter rhizosphaerae]RZS90127.1 LysM domain-containing protein [Motilibacter rhizosphaerae]
MAVLRSASTAVLATAALAAYAPGAVRVGSAALRAPGAGPAALDTCTGATAGLLVVAVLGWLALAGALCALAALPGAVGGAATVAAERVTPLVLRRALGALAGAAVVAAPAAPALAAGPAGTVRAPAVPSALAWTRGLPTADRPMAAPAPAPATASAPAAPTARTVTVRTGDSLWALAARQLGSAARPADVARAWPRWWHANTDQLGRHPDRLVPGQVLRIPVERPTRAR